jgi:hypothetical protein
VAPALHSLIISSLYDAVRILEVLFDSHVDLRKLILKSYCLGENDTDIIGTIVALYPDLEALKLDLHRPNTSASYALIPHLKKLSELDLSDLHVNYIYVKLLETHVCARGRM